MNKAELLLSLLKIAHHPAQADTLSLEIAERWLNRFDELGLVAAEETGAERAARPKKDAPKD